MSRIGAAAARRKFSPEFINRLDKIVVFKPLGDAELRSILDIELETVYQRLQAAVPNSAFQVTVAESARELLLKEGTDSRYGARHLKRAIERFLVQPLSNLLASGQIQRGDLIRVTHRCDADSLVFFREAAGRDAWKLAGSMAA
jgi:ATP-dependent Clp protease ATP-binding subunit ClpB